MSAETGVLYVVATPIGNLEDISRRAVNVLSSVALIAAEDTRRTLSLLAALGVTAPRLQALHEHNEAAAGDTVIGALQGGDQVALVSDAGTPLLSDPGFTLIRRCYDLDIPVRPVPGASAVTCALSVCPLPATDLQIAGFLPARSGARKARLQELLEGDRPFLFFEAPHRARSTLTSLAELEPARRVFVAREMTKHFETYLCDTGAALIEQMDAAGQWRGEFVCVVEGRARQERHGSVDAETLMRVLCAELAPAQAARLGAGLLKVRKSELYELALRIRA
ncbi:MAG: 16S rRNA (cytidine(1402)-2'-O)-methyltransferase [Pseudomonadales bacterium]